MSFKAKLEQIKSDNSNAYEVLKKVVGKIVLDQGSIDEFENYAFACRSQPKPQVVFKVRESYEHMKPYETSNSALIGKMNVGTSEEPQQPGSLTYQPNLMEESKMYTKLGIGFGEDETYRLFKSLALLSVKKSTKQLRLWGKILGTDKDYYIAQGLADGGEQAGQLSPDIEPKGTGINKFNYWVINNLTAEWTQLPIVTPQQILTSRKIKYLFTGNPKQQILVNPKFNGTEAHLLKCQIVRINSTCSIIPKGILIVNPEDPKDVIMPPEQQYKYPSLNELTRKQNWLYSNPSILKNGRTSHLKPQDLEAQQEQAWAKEQQQKDPIQPRLKNITLDNQSWILRTVDMDDKYKTVGRNPKIVSKGVVGIKNLIWPGWTTLAYQGKYSSIYVGYGHKAKQSYFPRQPQVVLSEYPDCEEAVVQE